MDMDCSSYVNTCLGLNTIRFIEEAPTRDWSRRHNSFQVNTSDSNKEEDNALAEELKRLISDNKKLTEMLTMASDKYTKLRDFMANIPSMKRKSESIGTNSEGSSTGDDNVPCKKQRSQEPTVKICARTETSDAVKDGYTWRKYGQKVTRDNPCPRAYFKCSFAPTCPVKKQVQRSVEDQYLLVSTYEGEHNHAQPCPAEHNSGLNRIGSSGPANMISFDLVKSKSGDEAKVPATRTAGLPEVMPRLLVEQMATSLTNDPNFTAALAAAISGKFFAAIPIRSGEESKTLQGN